jgi:hypothetical protein
MRTALKFVGATLAVIILLFTLATGLVILPVQIGFHLVFGWIAFLKRTLPQVTLNLSAVALALICIVLIIWGTHWFCAWLYGHIASRKVASQRQAWSLRWTSGICIATLLLFSTSIAITGICHQVSWWIRSKEPLYVPRSGFERVRNISDMKQQALEISMAGEESGWSLQAIEANIATNQSFSAYWSIENWHRVLIPDTNGQLVAAFIFHRDPNKSAKAGFCFVNRDKSEILSIEKLPEQLGKYYLQ